jgi:hypothetical protein
VLEIGAVARDENERGEVTRETNGRRPTDSGHDRD